GAAHRALAEGEALLIFPEGVSQPEPAIMPLRTGAARLVLGSGASAPRATLLPVGLMFHEPGTFRVGSAVVLIGEPVPTEDFESMPQGDEAVRRLTARLEGALRRLMGAAGGGAHPGAAPDWAPARGPRQRVSRRLRAGTVVRAAPAAGAVCGRARRDGADRPRPLAGISAARRPPVRPAPGPGPRAWAAPRPVGTGEPHRAVRADRAGRARHGPGSRRGVDVQGGGGAGRLPGVLVARRMADLAPGRWWSPRRLRALPPAYGVFRSFLDAAAPPGAARDVRR